MIRLFNRRRSKLSRTQGATTSPSLSAPNALWAAGVSEEVSVYQPSVRYGPGRLPDNFFNTYQHVLAENLKSVTELEEKIRSVSDSVQHLADVVLGRLALEEISTMQIIERTPVRGLDAVQERLRQRAATAVLNNTEWMTSAEVDGLVPGAEKRSNAHARANRLLSDGKVFAIEHGGRKRYPRYAFDALGTPYPAVREILQIFGDTSAFRVASWFESTSAALDGRRPRELIDGDPDAVIRAAREHVAGVVHG